MLSHFLEFIKKHALIDKGDHVLLAVSGGIDSMVMVELFQRAELSFSIAHCNFQLRGEESDKDEVFVEKTAKRLGLVFHAKSFDTSAYTKKKAISTQMAARDLRYAWFEELMTNFDYSKLSTAHHMDDDVETLFLNLMRGTSISGLGGIQPQSGAVIRPMLALKREQIHAFAEAEGVLWREDSSNRSDAYKRNYFRHNLAPLLKEMNPSYQETLSRSMLKLREVEGVFQQHIDRLKKELLKVSGSDSVQIEMKALKVQISGGHILERVLEAYGFTFDQCSNILIALDGIAGKQFYSESHVLVIDREKVFIDLIQENEGVSLKIASGEKEVSTHHRILFNQTNRPSELKAGPEVAYLDYDKLKFPLQLRRWQKGDSFMPLGMKNKKKVSDFMIDSKIPLNLKKCQEVILSDNEIVWLVGQRIDERYKVTDTTSNVFKISLDLDHV